MVSPWFPYGFSYGFPMFDWAFPMVSRVKTISPLISEVRSFEDCAAGVWDGTGFVVSLDNPKAGRERERDGMDGRLGHDGWFMLVMLLLYLGKL